MEYSLGFTSDSEKAHRISNFLRNRYGVNARNELNQVVLGEGDLLPYKIGLIGQIRRVVHNLNQLELKMMDHQQQVAEHQAAMERSQRVEGIEGVEL